MDLLLLQFRPINENFFFKHYSYIADTLTHTRIRTPVQQKTKVSAPGPRLCIALECIAPPFCACLFVRVRARIITRCIICYSHVSPVSIHLYHTQ